MTCGHDLEQHGGVGPCEVEDCDCLMSESPWEEEARQPGDDIFLAEDDEDDA